MKIIIQAVNENFIPFMIVHTDQHGAPAHYSIDLTGDTSVVLEVTEMDKLEFVEIDESDNIPDETSDTNTETSDNNASINVTDLVVDKDAYPLQTKTV